MRELEHKLIIDFHKRFNEYLEKAPLEIKISFREILEVFLANPTNPILRNHPLKEQYAGYRSIDITDDWRALFKIRETKFQTVITFHILGTHTQLYK